MAEELSVRLALTLARGFLKDKFDPPTQKIDVSADPIAAGVKTVGTSDESLDPGDVASEGVLVLHNLDDTNYVTYGPDDTGMTPFGKLKPNEFAFVRLVPGVTVVLKANTAACNVRYWLLSD